MLASFAIFTVLAVAPSVQWHAPPECPDDAAFAQRVGALLGGDSDASAQAVVTVQPDPAGGFRAEVRCVSDGIATVREVHGPVCESVADAAALVLAVQIDALAVGAATTPATTRVPEPVAAPPRSGGRVSMRPEVPTPRAKATSRIRGAIVVGGGGSFRQVPSSSAVIMLGAALLVRRARVELDAAWVLDRPARLPAPDASAGADVGLVAAALRAGFVPRVRTVEFPLLAGIEVGDMTAKGVGVRSSRLRHGAWASVLAGAGIAWVPVPGFALRLDPMIALAVARPRFGIDAQGGLRSLPRPPVVGVRLAATLEVRFP